MNRFVKTLHYSFIYFLTAYYVVLILISYFTSTLDKQILESSGPNVVMLYTFEFFYCYEKVLLM